MSKTTFTLIRKGSDQKTKAQRLEMRREKVEEQIAKQGKLLMVKRAFIFLSKDSDQKTKSQRLEMRRERVEE